MDQICVFFPAVEEVLQLPGEFGPELRSAMREILATDLATLKMEIAIIVDVGKVLVEFCYVEEGDGFLAPRLYQFAEKVTRTLDRRISGSEHLKGNDYHDCDCRGRHGRRSANLKENAAL